MTKIASLAELSAWLLTEHSGTVDADRLAVIEQELRLAAAAGVPGDVVEVGCFKGAMSAWMRAVLGESGMHDVSIHVYDSFQGLPEASEHDSPYLRPGELSASPADVLGVHARWGLRPPIIHAGWFHQTLPNQLPERICFAYLDGDYYASVYTSLEHVVPRLSPGGVLIVDDYADTAVNPRAWDGLPGVKKACDSYFGHPSPLTVVVGEGDLAFGRLQV